jgi:hypothetical protein
LPGLDPGIHVQQLLLQARENMGGRVKPGHGDML